MKRFYSSEIEDQMRHFFESLPERKRRDYAVIEANRIGFGGASYISEVLGISRRTIYNGKKSQAKERYLPEGKQRRAGGGRKKTSDSEFKYMLIRFIDNHKAGSPTDPDIYWISLEPVNWLVCSPNNIKYLSAMELSNACSRSWATATASRVKYWQRAYFLNVMNSLKLFYL